MTSHQSETREYEAHKKQSYNVMHVINKQIIRGAMIRVDERTRVDKNFRGFF